LAASELKTQASETKKDITLSVLTRTQPVHSTLTPRIDFHIFLRMTSTHQHIVIPGQIIATATNEEESFLRGHGTYIEQILLDHDDKDGSYDSTAQHQSNVQVHTHTEEDDEMNDKDHPRSDYQNEHLIASTAGVITRTNKLIQVTQPNAPYAPQTGDPVIGRITSISASKWNVSLNLDCLTLPASLPLTGINLPDGMQRMRTSADALSMRKLLKEGDVISAEVRTVHSASGTIGNVVLHARSIRCGKLENGCFVMVPNWLVTRMKKHFVTLGNQGEEGFDGIQVEVLLGCNGGIWIQLAMAELEEMGEGGGIMEEVQRIRKEHAQKIITKEERTVLARVKNAIEALKMVCCRVTPENICQVVASTVNKGYTVQEMLRPNVMIAITECTRR
jgi:exosome complex component RRP4